VAERQVEMLAHAKINVFLRVLGRRGDGYHDIESLVLPVSLADRLWIDATDDGLVTVNLITDARDSDPRSFPPSDNLIVKAADALLRRWEGPSGAAIRFVKVIPVAAGLGGGSADAAATLRSLNLLWECGLSEEELREVGADVGSDIPALLTGGPALVRGRGDMVVRVSMSPTWWVLAPQPFPVATPVAYELWDDAGVTGPDPAAVLEAAESGQTDALARLLFNDLERPVADRNPEIAEAKRALLAAGALGALMSGSGPTVAGLVRDEAHAREVAAKVTGAIPVSAPP
jgi:4-diphosphocytidyl-2-C-methyl-D-erythritol kinase